MMLLMQSIDCCHTQGGKSTLETLCLPSDILVEAAVALWAQLLGVD